MEHSKICIIDDNVAVCNSLTFLFTAYYNVNVKTFNDPLCFLEEYRLDWMGCLIIDLFMPSMNGIELVKILNKLNSNLKVIIMSGHATRDIAKQCLDVGAYAFISKPFKTEHLLKKVKQVLHLEMIE